MTQDKPQNVMTKQFQNGPIKTSLSVQIHLVKDTPRGLKHTSPHSYFTSNIESILSKSHITDFQKKKLLRT